jgi:hypothetical protein
MRKYLLGLASAVALFSLPVAALEDGACCDGDPTDPSCYCDRPDNVGSCDDGVHRGPALGIAGRPASTI